MTYYIRHINNNKKYISKTQYFQNDISKNYSNYLTKKNNNSFIHKNEIPNYHIYTLEPSAYKIIHREFESR